MYVLQTGCSNKQKEAFREQLEDRVGRAPAGEKVIIGADLNGRVRQ